MFRFRLQSVLDFRKQREEQSLAEFADIKRRLDHEMERLCGMMEDREKMTAHVNTIGRGDIRPTDIALHTAYIRRLKEQEQRQQAVIKTVEHELERKRTVLVETVKQRKIIENIRERRFEEYKAEVHERERKELDERGIINANKGGGR
ncbi:MAG TPA: flagellar export protein FliJ [Deltaproteobacteria bacterium]|nr:flagellar export protein FliJ [Deltaproteobacteria bacterium]